MSLVSQRVALIFLHFCSFPPVKLARQFRCYMMTTTCSYVSQEICKVSHSSDKLQKMKTCTHFSLIMLFFFLHKRAAGVKK